MIIDACALCRCCHTKMKNKSKQWSLDSVDLSAENMMGSKLNVIRCNFTFVIPVERCSLNMTRPGDNCRKCLVQTTGWRCCQREYEAMPYNQPNLHQVFL